MPPRMVGYIGRQIERHMLPIYAFVIYLRPDAGRRDPGRYEQDRAGFRVLIEYRVIRLIEIEGKGIIHRKQWGLLPFAPLMKAPEGWLRECVQATNEVPLSQRDKANFLADLSILSGLVYEAQTILNIILEEITCESSVVQHFAERGIQQGRVLSVLNLISERFSPDDAEELRPTLESIQDLEVLRQALVKR